MKLLRRAAIAVLLTITATAGLAGTATAGGQTNDAVAVNTEDGASVFRLAFSIRTVADGVVDQENLAAAYASCADCRTVALAFQVVLVRGDVDVATPVNQAVAYNDQCAACLTFVSATQIVIGSDGPVRITQEGRQRLHDLEEQLTALEDDIDTIAPGDLVRAVSAAEAELIAILSEELVPAGKPEAPPDGAGAATTTSSTTTSTTEGATTTTTGDEPSTTTTSAAEPTTTTTGG